MNKPRLPELRMTIVPKSDHYILSGTVPGLNMEFFITSNTGDISDKEEDALKFDSLPRIKQECRRIKKLWKETEV